MVNPACVQNNYRSQASYSHEMAIADAALCFLDAIACVPPPKSARTVGQAINGGTLELFSNTIARSGFRLNLASYEEVMK